MSAPASQSVVVTDWLRALLLGDLPALTAASLPHPDLATLVRPTPRPPVARLLRELPRLVIRSNPAAPGRYRVQTRLGGCNHALVLQDTATGPRVDATQWLA